MTTENELIASMTRLGFTQYEAQAYTALVGQAALTGAEVSRRASMPPSKVYETLARLESRGAVLVNRSEPVRYSAVPHAALLEELRTRFEADLEAAASALDQLPVEEEAGLVWSLSGRKVIVLRIILPPSDSHPLGLLGPFCGQPELRSCAAS